MDEDISDDPEENKIEVVDENKIVKEVTPEIYPNVEGRIGVDMVSDIYRTTLVEDGTIVEVCIDKKEGDILSFKAISGIPKIEDIEGTIENRGKDGRASEVKIVDSINVGIDRVNVVTVP